MYDMLVPIFTHGTYANTIKAIQEGKLKYPAYCWCTDTAQYGFLNKQNELEVIGIPELVGTIQNPIILSTLDDGIYQVKGQHKITASHITTYDSGAFIFVLVQTTDNGKKVSRIASDEVTKYHIFDDLSVESESYVTDAYLSEHKYATEEYLDEKIEILKHEIEDEISDLIEPVLRPMVEDIIDESIQSEDDANIRQLFDN